MAVHCNLCRSNRKRVIFRFPGYELVRCLVCGLGFMDPPLSAEAINKLYSQEYYFSPDSNLFGYSDYKGTAELIARTADKRLRELERLVPARGLLLDAGCAFGYYLKTAQSRGWNTVGVELSAHGAAEGRGLGLDIRQGILEAQGFASGMFDALTAWDLIEHLRDPDAFIRECFRILKPGGYLLLTTPDIDSVPAKLAGARWMGIKSREHLFFFSRKTMVSLLIKHGFTVTDVHYEGKFVSRELFVDRLLYYFPWLGALRGMLQKMLSAAWYINPWDILKITARKPE